MKKIFCNAKVITMDDDNCSAEAILVVDGKIARIGSNEDILAEKDDDTEVRDLDGKVLMPGFIDPHSHLTAVGYNFLLVNAKPSPAGVCDTREALIEEFKKSYAKGNFDNGEWLMGIGYDNSAFPDGKHITRLDLDQVSTDIPISCAHASGHCAVFNTKALQIFGYWGENYEVPEGGTVGVFPDTGEPDGFIAENAYLAPEKMAKMKMPDFSYILAAIKEACNLYASYGVTSCQDGRVTGGEYQLLMTAGQMGAINIDVLGLVAPAFVDQYLVKGQKVGPYTNHVRMGAYKIFIDGSPQAKTAWLSKPYHIPPEDHDENYCGFPVFKDEDLLAACKKCLENGWQLNVHCNGDAASEQLIRCYTQAIEETGIHDDLRPVMVHAQTVREDQLDRMKEIGMIPTFFLDHVYYWGDWHYESVLGPERAERISPVRSAIRRGMNYTMHQDSPVVDPNALFAVHNAVNRKTRNGRVLGEDQKISVMEALRGITINCAYQIFEEDIKGSITEGKLADLVILDKSPLEVESDKIKDIKILETIKEGNTIYIA